MGAVKFEVELPAELVLALEIERSELGRRAKEWIALALFQEGAISAGKAAEILDRPKTEFLQLLDDHGLPYLDSSLEELETDVRVALGGLLDEMASEHGPIDGKIMEGVRRSWPDANPARGVDSSSVMAK